LRDSPAPLAETVATIARFADAIDVVGIRLPRDVDASAHPALTHRGDVISPPP
jgi:hypothetical protein